MQAAKAAVLALRSSDNSTMASVALLRILAAEFADGTILHAASCIAGEAEKPGRKPIDDSAALARIAKLKSAGERSAAVGTVARLLAPDDAMVQAAIKRRLYRKLEKK